MVVTPLYNDFLIRFRFVTYFKDVSFDMRFTPLQCAINNILNKVFSLKVSTHPNVHFL